MHPKYHSVFTGKLSYRWSVFSKKIKWMNKWPNNRTWKFLITNLFPGSWNCTAHFPTWVSWKHNFFQMNFNLKKDHLVPIYLQKLTNSTHGPVLSFMYNPELVDKYCWRYFFLWREIKKRKKKKSHAVCLHWACWESLWKPLLKLMGLWHVLIIAIFIINFSPNHTQSIAGHCQHLSTPCCLLNCEWNIPCYRHCSKSSI